VIVIDRFPERLAKARTSPRPTSINYETDTDDPIEMLKQMTGGRGPDHVIDAVGMEAHGTDLYAGDRPRKQFTKLQLDRATALRQCIQACAKGGTVSIPASTRASSTSSRWGRRSRRG
jgi:threonine dehydrogenase-like Zn-dependent dehydrogenase